MRMVLFRQVRGWSHGKLAVLDISETGKQIGEKLFILLDERQKTDLAKFVLGRKEDKNNSSHISCRTPDVGAGETNIWLLFTEIHEGSLYFCQEQRKVAVCGQEIDLTAKEFDALQLLITNSKRVMTFETISYQVWGEEYMGVTVKAIHNLMSRLRQKLQIEPDMPEYIVSIRGFGYKFEPREEIR